MYTGRTSTISVIIGNKSSLYSIPAVAYNSKHTMEWLLALLAFLMTSFEMAALRHNYVTPNKMLDCSQSDGHYNCLTFQDYADQPDMYFTSDAIFYFESGRHVLNSSINFMNVHNLTFQGLSDSEVPSILFDSLVNITWDECSRIEVSLIVFTFLDYFNPLLIFLLLAIVRLVVVQL